MKFYEDWRTKLTNNGKTINRDIQEIKEATQMKLKILKKLSTHNTESQ